MSKLVFKSVMKCSRCGAKQYVPNSVFCEICKAPLEPSLIPVKTVACAMIDICPDASDRCGIAPGDTSQWRTQPNTRYMDCYSYKTVILGLTFTKTLGVYHLNTCPYCNGDLKKYLQNKLNSK